MALSKAGQGFIAPVKHAQASGAPVPGDIALFDFQRAVVMGQRLGKISDLPEKPGALDQGRGKARLNRQRPRRAVQRLAKACELGQRICAIEVKRCVLGQAHQGLVVTAECFLEAPQPGQCHAPACQHRRIAGLGEQQCVETGQSFAGAVQIQQGHCARAHRLVMARMQPQNPVKSVQRFGGTLQFRQHCAAIEPGFDQAGLQGQSPVTIFQRFGKPARAPATPCCN